MTAFADLTQFTVEISEHIALVTMNNPPVNAQGKVFHEEAALIFDRISDMVEVRVAVITGAGKCFSAGADIRGRAGVERPAGDIWQHNRRVRECFHSITECRKPVIAAINGPALGAGLALAAACDILVAAEEGSLGLPEIDVGLLGGGRHAMRLFSHSRIRRMMLTGYRVPGPELYRLGIVEACTTPEELMPAAMELAQTIASKSPVSTRMGKHTLNVIEDMSLRDGYRYEQDMTAQIGKTEDAKEAQLAFKEKRAPVFKGR